MRCFIHTDRESIGICLACGRGVCDECASEQGGALSCRNRCEGSAARTVLMRDLAIHEANEQQSVAKSKQIQHAVVSVILIFIGVAIALISIGNPMGLICGGTCAVLGVVAALSAGFGDRREGSLRACPKCGYNLTGAVTPGCPECGWKLDELLTEPVSKK